jgi:outer membrane immunogenic protein
MRIRLASLLTVALSLGAAQAVSAADIPAPVYKAPPVAIVAYNWNGFYVGGHFGWGWAHDDNVGYFTRDPPPAVGAHAGDIAGSFPVNFDGVLGGGQIGFNYLVWPHIVLGIEADISAANLDLSSTQVTTSGIAVLDVKLDWLATARGRIGYASNQWLVYGTGGAAWVHGNFVNTQTATFLGGGAVGQTESWSTTRTGWTAGGGVEYGIARNWTAKLEYLYMDFGDTHRTMTVFNRTVVDHLTMNVVRLGVNYKF